MNPWGGSLVAIEEPENGVQPQRIELIADLLMSMSSERRQIIVTSHSPIFCTAAIHASRKSRRPLRLYGIVTQSQGTSAKAIDLSGPLFESNDIRDFLQSSDDSDSRVVDTLMRSGALYAL